MVELLAFLVSVFLFSHAANAQVSTPPDEGGATISSTDELEEGDINLYFTDARVTASPAVAACTLASHTHSNKALLDTYTQLEADLADAVSKKHVAVTLGTANGLSLSTQQLSLQAATSGQNGALTSTDWSTFNGKQSALGDARNLYVGFGTYATIQSAVNAAELLSGSAPSDATGVTVHIPAGSFAETVTIRKNVHLQGAGRAVTRIRDIVIRPTDASNAPDFVKLQNFTVTGDFTAANQTTASSGIYNASMLDGDGLRISEVTFDGGTVSFRAIGSVRIWSSWIAGSSIEFFNTNELDMYYVKINGAAVQTGDDSNLSETYGGTQADSYVYCNQCAISSYSVVQAGTAPNPFFGPSFSYVSALDAGANTDTNAVGTIIRTAVTGLGSVTGDPALTYFPTNPADWTSPPTTVTEALDTLAASLTGGSTPSDVAYDATSWDANFGSATKNALRDEFEVLISDIAGKEPALTAGTSAQYYRGDKSWQTLNTTAVPEGSNLYYTTTRFDSRFDTRLALKTTADLAENASFKYYTDARAKTACVSDTAYNATSWDAVTDVAPSKNAVRDQIETMLTSISGKEPAITAGTTSQYLRGDKSLSTFATDAKTAAVNNTAYNATSWDGVLDVAPSKNAVRDQFEALSTIYEPALAANVSTSYYRGDKTWQTLNATAVGLGNVSNNAQLRRDLGTAKGQIIGYNASDSPQVLSAGADGLPLLANSGAPVGIQYGVLGIAGGGTGQTTATAAFDALSPNTTKGDLIVRSSTSNARLAIGSDSQVLMADSSQTQGVRWAEGSEAFDPTRSFVFFDDFIEGTTAQLGWVASAAAAGGAASLVNIGVTPSAGRPGQFRFETGTTATGRASLNQSGSALLLGGGPITVQFPVLINNVPTAAQDYTLRVGLGDNVAAESTDAVYFWISSASANWQIKTINNTTPTTANCGIAYSAVGAWQTLKIVVDATAASVTFYVNGVACTAPITTNIPTGSTRNLGPMLYMQKTLGATNAITSYDYFYMKQIFTTAR
jgi:hypothetical protein